MSMTPDAHTTNFFDVPADTTPPFSKPIMSLTHLPKPHHPNNDLPDKFEPGAPPVEPDEGPVPALDPVDPAHNRVVDPAANQTLQVQPTRHHVEASLCP